MPEGTVKCPACGAQLALTPVAVSEPTIPDAATMPLDQLRSKLPQAGY